MTNIRSPLTENTQSSSTTSRSPVRTRAAVAELVVDETSTSISVSGWSPSVHGHHSRGSSMSRFQSTSLRPPASDCSCSVEHLAVDRACRRARSAPRRCRGGRASAGGRASSLTSRHSTRNRSIRTGPVSYDPHRSPDAAGVPVGSIASQFWNTPVMVRFDLRSALRRAGHFDRQHVLVAEPRQRGDVEGVREEVALRIAEVGAVEPDVGLVEDAVERHPTAAPGAAGAARTACGRAAGRRCRRTRDGCASGRAPRSRASRRRSRGPTALAPQVVVGHVARHVPMSSTPIVRH